MSFNARYQKLVERIGSNTKKIRNKRGYTQKDMEELGFNYRFYQRIESGKKAIRLETLLRLAEALDCDVTDLVK